MIEFVQGDLLAAPVEALVNAVNTEGVMGKGLALQFKEKFPLMYAEYRRRCTLGFRPGDVMPVKVGNGRPAWILNVSTKDKWRNPSRIEYVTSGLHELHRTIRSIELHSVAVPALGCGLGGLKWADVRPLIVKILGDLEDVRILVYEPQ